jgi:hypothetical protein
MPWKVNFSCELALAAGAVALLLGGAAVAGVASCEKIKDADAYNSCLASFGPAAGDHKITAPPAEANAPKAVRRRAHRPEKYERGPKRQANGRVRIEIIPGQ